MRKLTVPVAVAVTVVVGVVSIVALPVLEAAQRRNYRAVCVHGPSITQIWYSGCMTNAAAKREADRHNRSVHGGARRASVVYNAPGIPRCR